MDNSDLKEVGDWTDDTGESYLILFDSTVFILSITILPVSTALLLVDLNQRSYFRLILRFKILWCAVTWT